MDMWAILQMLFDHLNFLSLQVVTNTSLTPESSSILGFTLVELYSSRWFIVAFLLISLVGLSACGYCLRSVFFPQKKLTQYKASSHALAACDLALWHWRNDSQKFYLDPYPMVFQPEKQQLCLSLEELAIHKDDFARVKELWQNLLTGQHTKFETELRYLIPNQGYQWFRVRGQVEKSPNGLIHRVTGIFCDISSQHTLLDKANLLANAFEHTTEGVLILDLNHYISVANVSAHRLLGERLEGEDLFSLVSEGDQKNKLKRQFQRTSSWNGELEIRTQDGLCPVWLNISVMRNKQQVSHYVAVICDIRERKRNEEELKKLANYDSLTGLPNRSLFFTKLNQAIEEATKKEEKLALLFLDLDRFKLINDSYGHTVGDALLIEAATRLQNCVGSDHSVCRFGGDEFVTLFKGADKLAKVDAQAKAILTQMSNPFRLYGREFLISTCVGISIWPDDAKDPEKLIKNADLAMYHAKEQGRGNFQYFLPERKAMALFHLRLEEDLRIALDHQQFSIYYQPQIDVLGSHKLMGMEALARWHHPNKGNISPETFVKVAESCGLIIDVDFLVLARVCRDRVAWCSLLNHNIRVAVNISAVSFHQVNFVERLQRILHETQMQPAWLELEITEGVLMRNLDVAQNHIQQLTRMGISIAIDDFGTGYSSLAYLRHFKVDILKIDRTFLTDIATHSTDQAIVSSIVELARNLGLMVIAEGVETQVQLEQVLLRGCHIIQGYYFAKPMSNNEMNAWLIKSANSQAIPLPNHADIEVREQLSEA